ncbi:MAG: NIL domain-containing protein [bacterium]
MAVIKVLLRFPPERLNEPIIYNIGHKFNVITNIRSADIGQDAGWAVLEIMGEEDEIQRSLDYAKSIGVRVEPPGEDEFKA